ncbi:hypothetical protein QQ045_031819 [Rhodiola kirilowii]
MSSEDDSENPSKGIFPCSPAEAVKSKQSNAAPDSFSAGGVRSVRFTEKFGERSSKENMDVNVDGTKLNMDPLQMKRRKKAGGYNLRKSLAWNKAFFTEEGVLDPEELSLVTGTYNLSSGEPLSAIQEEKRKPGKRNSPHVQSPKEKLFMKSPGLERGLSPRCDSSSRYRGSPAKQNSSPHVRRLVLSVHEANRKGEKQNGCPRPPPSSSYKRPATATTSSATSKEPKLTKSSAPRAERCSPMVPGSALSKANCSSRIPGTEAKRVVSAPKSIAYAAKGSLANTKSVKGSIINTRGIKGIAKSASSVKTSPSKESAQLQGRNKSKLPPKVPTPRGPQAPNVSELNSAPVKVLDQVCQQGGGSNKHNYIPLPQKYMPSDAKQVAHVQVGKPTGLRMPSPSLGFFGRPKQSAPVGDTHVRNISDSTANSNNTGTRSLSVAERPLQAPGKVPGVSNGALAIEELRCFGSDLREPLFTDNSVEIEKSTGASNSSPDVQADFLEKCSQTLSHDIDRKDKIPAEIIKCDERADMEAVHMYDDLQDVDRSNFGQPKSHENLAKANSSCREELIDSLSCEGYTVSKAETQGCSGFQPDKQRSMHVDQPSLEKTETRKMDSGKAHQKKCKESLDDQMDYDVSFASPQLKRVENQEVVSAPCKEDPKDSLSLGDNSFSLAETQDYSDHIQPLTHDNKKGFLDNDQQSVEGVETTNPDSSGAHQAEYEESLNGGKTYDPSLPDESFALDIKEHIFSIDCPEDCYLSEHRSVHCLSRLKSVAPAIGGNIGEDINNEVHVASHVYTSCLMNHVSSLGTLNGNSSESSYIATGESQMVVSELMKASGNELNSSESFPLQTHNSDTLQKVGVHEVEDAASCSLMKDEQPSCVEEELSVDFKMPSPQTESDHIVVDMYQIFSKCDSQMQMFNKDDDLMDISNSDLEEMVDEELLSGAQTEETVHQPGSKHIVEHSETWSDIFLEEFQTTESKNIADIELLKLKSIVDHESDCSLDADKESEGVDRDELGNPSSQIAILEQVKVVCRADACTTKDHAESVSSDKCSLSETCHQDSLEDKYDIPDAGQERQSSRRGTNLDVVELERHVSVTVSSEDDTTCNIEVEHVQDDTTSNLEESAQSPCNSNRSNPKPTSLKIKPPPNAVPFSDEWLAAIEAAGEDVLTLKSGAVQHSPPDKSAPEPSPWSPVKRHKNQELGPFDCTKHTNVPQPPADD